METSRLQAGTLNYAAMRRLAGLALVLPWLGGSLLMASAFALTVVPWLAGDPRLWQIVSCAGAALLALSPAERPVAFVLGLLLPFVSVEPAPFDISFGVLLALRWAPRALRTALRSPAQMCATRDTAPGLPRSVSPMPARARLLTSGGRRQEPRSWLTALQGLPRTTWGWLHVASGWLHAGDGWLVLFVGGNLISAVAGGGSWRYLGLTAYMVVLYLVTREWDASATGGMVAGYVAGSVVELLAAVVGRVSGNPLLVVAGTYVRMKGTFKDPNVFGAHYVPLFLGGFALLLLATLGQLRGGRRAARAAITTIVGAFGIITSYSRGAVLAAAAGVAAVLMLLGLWRDHRARAWLVVLIVLGVVGAAVLQLGMVVVEEARAHPGRSLTQHVEAGLSRLAREVSTRKVFEYYDYNRFRGQWIGLGLAWRYPLGVGPGQFTCFAPIDPHNLFVRALAENGWLGFISLVAWLRVVWISLWKVRTRPAPLVPPTTFLALFASLLVHSLVISTLHWRHFWIILGLAMAAVREEASSPAPCEVPGCSRPRPQKASQAPALSPYVLSGLKRAFDVVLAGLGLLVSVPIWLFIMLAILAEDGRPVLYTQARLGMGGRPFTLLKFRSMTRDAERTTGPVLASASDPRVTRVGRLLRATAMDELPQLVNIFLGHMSFVGPRPERPELVAEIVARCPEFARRQAVRPGLTGPAQVFGHYETDPAEKLVYDLDYIRTATFWGDLRLILRSFWITFTARWQERSGHLSQPAQPAARRQINRKSAADDK